VAKEGEAVNHSTRKASWLMKLSARGRPGMPSKKPKLPDE
jgi:hypothetical protein